MVRSILAMTAAALVGMVLAKLIESAGNTAFPGPEGVDLSDPVVLRNNVALVPIGLKLVLLAGWGAGAFGAGLTALLIGRRWAPLGWLSAMTMFFLAFVTMIGQPLAWWLWPGAAIVTATGGLLAIRIMNAQYAYPGESAKEASMF